ncbi:hypothetical protein C6P40_000576 [Pichia californica]|uniref:Major facilitator superfamily (MFS) profile domain-containing protein n=1 Tax=Pichia californica TaxID=460514 RepID=A0A9P7BE04_9ASCO|nr:hypothetical protein C6P42_000525 [[Candida] californica]KAG0688742.1 hypothetical protein C6P40_000576 [[Candida] californica]
MSSLNSSNLYNNSTNHQDENISHSDSIRDLRDHLNFNEGDDDLNSIVAEDEEKDNNDYALLKIVSTKIDDYTILTKNERTTLAMLLALIGLCSAMSMPIYWTALPQLAIEFHTTEEKINFTVTSYLCFQAVAPVFVSSLSDIFGRRPVILACIAGGIATNVGLAVSRTYWLIVFLRCILATFLAPLISISSACVGDFTTRRNRGGLTGLTSGFTLIGQGISPFLGAVMDTAWGWPAIFWFSAALEGFILIVAFFMLPETHRGFVGDLSVRPKHWLHQSPILLYFGKRIVDNKPELLQKRSHKYQPWKPLKLIFRISVFYILLPSSILFAIWTISQTTLSVHLGNNYNYSTLHVGLCFFAPGCATVFGTLASGRILDFIYKKQKAKYEIKYSSDIEKSNISDIPPFNIINVRLYCIPVAACVVCFSAIVFGWCIQHIVHISVILIMCFLITFFCMFPLNITGTVLIDMFPEISGGATALNNLFRCGMSAIFVSCLTRMEKNMSTGGTYTFMAGIGLLSIGMILLLMKKSDSILREAREKKLRSLQTP